MDDNKQNVTVEKSLVQKFTILSGKTGIPRKDLLNEALEMYLKSKGEINEWRYFKR